MSLTFDQKIKAEVKILKAHTKLCEHRSSYYIYIVYTISSVDYTVQTFLFKVRKV